MPQHTCHNYLRLKIITFKKNLFFYCLKLTKPAKIRIRGKLQH
jgi:hypothetical protein